MNVFPSRQHRPEVANARSGIGLNPPTPSPTYLTGSYPKNIAARRALDCLHCLLLKCGKRNTSTLQQPSTCRKNRFLRPIRIDHLLRCSNLAVSKTVGHSAGVLLILNLRQSSILSFSQIYLNPARRGRRTPSRLESSHLPRSMAAVDPDRRNKHPRLLSEHERERLEEFIESIHYSSRCGFRRTYMVVC